MSITSWIEEYQNVLPHFGPWVYPRGSYVITHVRPSVVRPSVVRPSVFKYHGNCSLVLSQTLHDVRGQEGKKCDTARILKKILMFGLKGIKCQKLGFRTSEIFF